jgi:hypothetical protein
LIAFLGRIGSQFTKGNAVMPMGENDEMVEGMRLVLTDLCALGGTLLLETSVVGITLADTGQVVAWKMGGIVRLGCSQAVREMVHDTYRTTRGSRRWCRNLDGKMVVSYW